MFSGFSGNSAGKESTCSAGEPSLTPESGRYPGEGIGYPLQYSQDSLETQMVKNPRETWVRSLGWEDPLEKAWQPTPVFLPGESLWTEEPGGLQSIKSQRVGHNWAIKHAAHTRCVFMSFNLYHCWYTWFLNETLKYLESSKATGLFTIIISPNNYFSPCI